MPPPPQDNLTPEEKLINAAIVSNLNDKNGKISRNYTVAVDGSNKNGAEFIKSTNKTKFPPYKGLKVGSMNKIPSSDLNTFFEKSHPTEMDYLHLQHDGTNIDSYVDSMCDTLKVVKREIFLEFMEFNDKNLNKILESSAHVDRLVLKDCTLNLKSSFKGANALYNISTLNLYGCFKKNPLSFADFANGMKSTNLKDKKFELQVSAAEFEKKSKKKGKSKGSKSDKLAEAVEEALLKDLKDIYQNISFTYRIIEPGDYNYKGPDLEDEVYEGQVVGDEIAGHGFYVSRNGQGRRVHYCKDLIHQYEEINYPDGSTYKGYVRDGKKHGIGIENILSKGKKKSEPIYGLFIGDKLKQEFDDEDVRDINNGNGVQVEYFQDNKKYKRYIESGQKFTRPDDFDLIMGEVEARIKEMKK